ncbi:MAG: TolB family protein [Bacillota bacterium]
MLNLNISAGLNTLPAIAVIAFDAGNVKNAAAAEEYRAQFEVNLLNSGRFKIIEKTEWQPAWDRLDLPLSPASLAQNPKLKEIKGIDYLLVGIFLQTENSINLSLRLLALPGGDIKQSFIWRSDDEKWSEFLARFWLQIKGCFLIKGRVMKVDQDRIYLGEGISAKTGAFPGDIYLIQREKQVVLDSGEVLGTEMEEIAKIKITQVYDDFAVGVILEKKGGVIPGDIARETIERSVELTVENNNPLKKHQFLAFSSNQNGDYDIYIRDFQGNAKNLTRNPALDLYPSWSPGQAKLAFCSNREGKFAIYVLNLKDSQTTRISPPNGYIAPVWSPDGSMIAFLATRNGLEEGGIYVMNADGTGIRRLTKNDCDSRPSWSKDGKTLFFSGRRGLDLDFDIYAIDINTGAMVNISKNVYMDMYPVCAPEQTKLVFISDRDGVFSLYCMDYRSLLITRISEVVAAGIVNGITWTPDEKAVVMSFYRNGETELYEVNLEKGNVNILFSEAFDELEPAWTK